ncbi:MAG: 16S rRNA processing protein RimM, partial [Acidobacteria bacterium]|nr:16S rRNA processing protein RimM [Acidobacteriota bacterium]
MSDAPEDVPPRSGENGDLVSIARIARPHGLRGEVVADLLTDFPERFGDLDSVRLRLASGATAAWQVEWARPHKDRVLLKFLGVDDVEQAGMLRAAVLLVTRDELVPLPADRYYDFDLVGCEVVIKSAGSGEPVGRVSGVEHFGAAPLLVVVTVENREHLIPLAASICVEVDIARKRIVVD